MFKKQEVYLVCINPNSLLLFLIIKTIFRCYSNQSFSLWVKKKSNFCLFIFLILIRPTASFSLSNVVMRHDVPDVGPMSEQYPHLIFSNLTSKLGQRTTNILKYLFPVPKEDSHRTITFVNQDDYISFRFDKNKKKKIFFLLKLILNNF